MSANIRVLCRPKPVFDEPILTNAMVQAAGFTVRSNINFPCLTEPPAWALGLVNTAPVWLFFSDHNGREIRAAYASTIETLDWTIVPPEDDICASLSLDSLRLIGTIVVDPPEIGDHTLPDPPFSVTDNHFGSPSVHWDDATQVGHMYWHGECVGNLDIPPEGDPMFPGLPEGEYPNTGWRHGAGLAVTGADLSAFRAAMIAKGHNATRVNSLCANVPANDVGRVWRVLPEQLGQGETGNPTYFRVWVESGVFYAVSNQGDPRRCETTPGVVDPHGCSKFRSLADPNAFTDPLIDGVATIRHCEWYNFSADFAWFLNSRPREADVDPLIPEHIRVALIDKRAGWGNWEPVELNAAADTPANVTLRRPMRAWEGTGIAIDAFPTAISGAQQILLDPHVYVSRSGRVYFLCAAKGEQGIGLYYWNEAA